MARILDGLLGAEGATGVSEDVFDRLQQRQGPHAIINYCDFLGTEEAKEFVFKTFRMLIAESELEAFNMQHGAA